jgi:ribonuclease HI
VLFDTPDSEPLVSTRSVAIIGSNELELQAALFALGQAQQHFPDRPLALFSDNQDAVARLNRAKTEGLTQDPALQQMLAESGITVTLGKATICWIKGHGSCRGNILADLHAAEAANRMETKTSSDCNIQAIV